MGLTAAEIESVHDFSVEEVEVPEWGGSVYVRTLTADQRDAFVSRFIDEASGRARHTARQITATLLAMTLCDETGRLTFPNQERGTAVLAAKAAAACDPIFDAAMRLNKLAADDIEDLAKNLPPTTNAGSDTG